MRFTAGDGGSAIAEAPAPECGVSWVRALERRHLRDWLRGVIVPGLEDLVDPAAAPSALIAMADRQARHLRNELEGSEPSAAAAADPLVGAREEERAWVRGHLHDTALQILEFIAGDGFGTGLSAKQIGRLAGGAARDLRRWLDAESEPAAEPRFVSELEQVALEARSLHADVELSLEVGDMAGEPPREQAAALAGAVREALTNARKHARATRIVVRVEASDDGRTAVTVTDDGVGFDPERVHQARGLGVRGSIVGRMERVGGFASLARAPGGGTCVTLLAPLQEAVR